MHADALYHRMLDQEKAIAAAKEAGLPPPTFEPVAPRVPAVTIPALQKAAEEELIQPSEEMLQGWKKKLNELPPEERVAEEQALWADFRARSRIASAARQIWQEEAAERRTRQAEGKGTWADAVAGLLRPGNAQADARSKKDGPS